MTDEAYLFQEAREKILDLMESLSKMEHPVPTTLFAMMVPILMCAHDTAPSDEAVTKLIEIANRLAKELSEGGQK